MSINLDKKLKNSKQTGLIQKTFTEYRDRLLEYARTYYRNEINDFSETSLGGMFLDFAALVGDSMSYYIDQQINELDYEKATNIENINKHLRKAGIKSVPPSPAITKVTFSIIIPSFLDQENSIRIPDPTKLPVIKKGTTLGSFDQIPFVLSEDLDFTKQDYKQEILNQQQDGTPIDFVLSLEGLCVSGELTEETTFLTGNPGEFLTYTIQNTNVTFIEKVMDSDLNEYYEVEFLSQDTVYKKVENVKDDGTYFEILPTPYRFVKEENFNSGITTLRFGNGDGKTLKDDVLINPEDLNLPLLGRDYFPRFSLDPQKLLTSLSLGVSPIGKSIIIRYMHGGGISHNIPARSINSITNPIITFPNMESNDDQNNLTQLEVIDSISVINLNRAIGGTNGASIDELRLQIPNTLKQQSRVITYKDLLSRLYTMPSNFGRVHRAAVVDNPYTKLSKDLYITCKDENGFFVNAQDVLKINIQKYLNEFRLIGDTFNIVDAPIFNFEINLNLKIRAGFDILNVIEETKITLVENMRFDSLQIGEAININDIIRICSNINGVLSIVTPIKDIIKIKTGRNNIIDEEGVLQVNYNNNLLNISQNLDNGLLFPEPGGIFELKYSSRDINIRGT